MRITFTKILFAFIAVVSTLAAKAQTDYVITLKGDSIPCSITIPLIGKLKYKVDSAGESKKIKPGEIREYYIARKNLTGRSVYKTGSNNPMFMPLIEKGKINLYEMVYTTYTGTTVVTTTSWYVSKGKDTVSDLKTSSFWMSKSRQKRKDIFGDMLKDDKELYDKYMGDDKFSFKQIRNLVHLYNTGQPLSD